MLVLVTFAQYIFVQTSQLFLWVLNEEGAYKREVTLNLKMAGGCNEFVEIQGMAPMNVENSRASSAIVQYHSGKTLTPHPSTCVLF